MIFIHLVWSNHFPKQHGITDTEMTGVGPSRPQHASADTMRHSAYHDVNVQELRGGGDICQYDSAATCWVMALMHIFLCAHATLKSSVTQYCPGNFSAASDHDLLICS